MQEQVFTLVADFSIRGNLAYLSHQETLKMFQRALIRASVPLMFSMGFNPHPRLSIPFARSVGTQSVNDRVCAVVQLSEETDMQKCLERVQQQLPSGCVVSGIRMIPGKCTFYPRKVRYIFSFKSSFKEVRRQHFDICRKQLLTEESIEIQRYRAKKRRYSSFDLAPYLDELEVADDRLEVVCRISQSGTVRVDELMQWLDIESEQLAEPVCRTEIRWHQN